MIVDHANLMSVKRILGKHENITTESLEKIITILKDK
jgi:hypothetical protein